MSDATTLRDVQHTAVLLMDYQNEIFDRTTEQHPGLGERAARVLHAARAAGVPVMYVVVRFREGYPEVSPRNRSFAAIRESHRMVEGTAGAEIVAQVAPRAGEPVIVKHRVGAFSGTDLEVLLRARSITTLILMGISTSGVVLSTTRWAADADYALYIVEDCCADVDPEVHRVLMEKVFPRQASVLRAEAVITSLNAAASAAGNPPR